MSFSPVQLAFEGFRLTLRDPRLMVALGLVWAAFMAIVLLLEGHTVIALMRMMEEIGVGAQPSQEEGVILTGYYGRLFLVIGLPYLLVTAVMTAAVHRAVLTPEAGRYAYLRLGRDELRVAVVSLVVGLLCTAAAFTGGMAVAISIALAAVMPPLVLLAVLLGIVLLAIMVGLWAALLLAVPMTMSQKKITVWGAVRAIRGNYWRIFGMALLALLLAVGVGLLLGFVSMPFIHLTGGLQALVSAGSLTPAAIGGTFVWLFFQSVTYAAQLIIMQAPLAAAWQAIKGTAPNT